MFAHVPPKKSLLHLNNNQNLYQPALDFSLTPTPNQPIMDLCSQFEMCIPCFAFVLPLPTSTMYQPFKRLVKFHSLFLPSFGTRIIFWFPTNLDTLCATTQYHGHIQHLSVWIQQCRPPTNIKKMRRKTLPEQTNVVSLPHTQMKNASSRPAIAQTT